MNLRFTTFLGLAAVLVACPGDDASEAGNEETTGGDTTSADTTGPSTTNGTTTTGTTDATTAPTTTPTTDPTTNGETDDDTATGTGTDDGVDDTGTDETGTADICEDVQDPCGVCVCTECDDELAACDEDPGCVAIRECVIESGCSGTAECLEACGAVIQANGGLFGASVGLAQDLGDCVEESCEVCTEE
jgi:hypothetical protein